MQQLVTAVHLFFNGDHILLSPHCSSEPFSSVQFKKSSLCSGKPMYTPPHSLKSSQSPFRFTLVWQIKYTRCPSLPLSPLSSAAAFLSTQVQTWVTAISWMDDPPATLASFLMATVKSCRGRLLLVRPGATTGVKRASRGRITSTCPSVSVSCSSRRASSGRRGVSVSWKLCICS